MDIKKGRILYFAYASNMSESRIRFKGISFDWKAAASLHSYSLRFNNIGELPGQGYGNIVWNKNDSVEGIVYCIPESDIIKLDKWEKCPEIYLREKIEIQSDIGEKLMAEVYVSKSEFTRPGLLPAKEYLNWILEGKDYLSEQYFDKLSKQETLD